MSISFRLVSAIEFQKALTDAAEKQSHIEKNVEMYSLETLNQYRTYLSVNRLSGYAIKADGELTAVFSGVKGRGHAILVDAIKNGAFHLNAFEGFLTNLYMRYGFKEYRRESNWDINGPNVIYMRLG
jgi:hypothetical protein